MRQGILFLIILLLTVLIFAYPCGIYLAKVARMAPIRGCGPLLKIENFIYSLIGFANRKEMTWQVYAKSLLAFNILGILFVYIIQRMQHLLPLNPQKLPAVNPDLAFNTAVSFGTNTNWQSYSGEQTLSYFTQMIALTGQNFFSAATGIAVLFALIRGFTAQSSLTIGNYWVDLTRVILYILLPLSIIFAIFFLSQGVIQNFSPFKEVKLIAPFQQVDNLTSSSQRDLAKDYSKPTIISTQFLPMGPAASQESIKLLGTNGGGFFNVNSAHPYENPNKLTNFIQLIAILLIPFSLCFAFGILIGDLRQGIIILSAMIVIFVSIAVFSLYAEHFYKPNFAIEENFKYVGGNMEGKETRFGINHSAIFSTIATSTSCGAVNSSLDSYTALGSIPPLLFMQLGEVIFGGVGQGLYSMLLFAILAVFIAGLMIGKAPTFLGKKIQIFEMKMTAIAVLITPSLVLLGAGIALSSIYGKSGIGNPGPHGFTEIVYNLTSVGNNNGSTFAALDTNTKFYNILLAIIMWFGRFGTIIPILAISGSLASKPRLTHNLGSLPTNNLLFSVLLAGTLLLIGLLNYVPTLMLGPLIEYLISK